MARGDGHDETLRGEAASEEVAQVFSFFEVVAQAVVKVEVAAACLSGGRWWVDAQGERAFRLFICALNERLLRDDGARANKDRKSIESYGGS